MTNPIISAYQGSDLFGKLIFVSLFFLSIITWVLFLQKFFMERAARLQGVEFQKKCLQNLSTQPENHPFGALFADLHSVMAERLQEHSFFLPVDMDYIRAHLERSTSFQVRRMEKRVFVLSTIVSLAPFLGLLGTVWGILLTFAELQAGGVGNANATVMGGLAMALGTTVLGLLVAIPALIAYNYLRSAIRHFAQEMEDFSKLLLASVELKYARR
ncbi:MAG: MotA/TolQ/ExbB proton channel family protein [Chlamydiales bacterium]